LALVAVAAVLFAGCSGHDRPKAPGGWSERGIASWYGGKFHGRATASGEIYDMEKISAAHKSLPFGAVVRVRNLDNGRSLDVRINDRGPFVRGRIIDLSRAAARQLGMLEAGIAPVRLTLVRTAPRPAIVTASGAPPSRAPSRAPDSRAEVAAVPWIQVGAFRDRDLATRLAERLAPRFQGGRVYSDEIWHRVQFRDSASRDDAARLLRKLEAAGYSCFIVER
jgi:rare lipoprotein A